MDISRRVSCLRKQVVTVGICRDSNSPSPHPVAVLSPWSLLTLVLSLGSWNLLLPRLLLPLLLLLPLGLGSSHCRRHAGGNQLWLQLWNAVIGNISLGQYRVWSICLSCSSSSGCGWAGRWDISPTLTHAVLSLCRQYDCRPAQPPSVK